MGAWLCGCAEGHCVNVGSQCAFMRGIYAKCCRLMGGAVLQLLAGDIAGALCQPKQAGQHWNCMAANGCRRSLALCIARYPWGQDHACTRLAAA